jgi:trk system potassium uptake protein TrkA
MLAMYCSGSVNNIVTKIDRIESTGVLDVLPLGSVIHPKELASNEIVRYVRAMQNQSGAAVTVHSIADSMAEASEFAVTAATRNLGVPLKDIRLKDHVLVACIAHGPTVEIPDGDSVISEGDTVIVVTDGSRVIGQLNDIFE